jgi:hypothetical protein
MAEANLLDELGCVENLEHDEVFRLTLWPSQNAIGRVATGSWANVPRHTDDSEAAPLERTRSTICPDQRLRGAEYPYAVCRCRRASGSGHGVGNGKLPWLAVHAAPSKSLQPALRRVSTI